MDDYPAGPASPGPRRAPLSVVIPVRNGGEDFQRCLRALGHSTFRDFELIVVDDGSTDDSAGLAERAGARVLRHDQVRGPAAARNTGARAAVAPLIFFLDADVAVHPDTLGRAVRRFEADRSVAAVFGSYDDRPAAPGLVSRFRNLLHHYIHQSGAFEGDARPAHTFWTGCGAIRRDIFLDLGGFDPLLYRRPAIEDIELGYRMVRAGHPVLLARDLQATHLKRWSLLDMVKTDILRRGVPWMLLIWRSGVAETDLNVSRAQRACVASIGLAGLGPVVALGTRTPLWAVLTPAGLAVMVCVNRRFYGFLSRRLGLAGLVGGIPLHALYYACCGASVAIAYGLWVGSSRIRAGSPAQADHGTRPDGPEPLPRPVASGMARRGRGVAHRDD